jgi:hypothetical protein
MYNQSVTSSTSLNLTIHIAHSIHEIAPSQWDGLSAGLPFQSHRWYQFGERVMRDCEPVYLLAYQGEKMIGRASLWVIRDEPLPIGPGTGRAILKAILRRWPLLVCRSPLANASGLVLPPSPSRDEALQALTQSALEVSRQKRCSFLLFDFVSKETSEGWPNNFVPVTVSEPGTILQNRWQSLEEYLAEGNKKDRQHYKRTLHETGKLGITMERHTRVPDVTAALDLIHKVDRHYRNETNPWTRGLLENLDTVNGTWLEARQNGKLVGCGASFDDNGAQLTTALGLEENVPYVYLLLTYASLAEAFSKHIRLLRWGSGAYDVKRQLGFELEDNGCIVVSSNSPLLKFLVQSFS